MSKILVTGATGFVGQRLCEVLAAGAFDVVPVFRQLKAVLDSGVVVGDIGAATDWSAALAGIGVIVHLAARVHVMQERSGDPLAEFRAVNVDATLNLAQQAAANGVRRFVFVSSVKVNGEATNGTPFTVSDTPAPGDPYGVSKMEAEIGLRELGRQSGMEIVIVRPPLVYGPGVRANFLRLMQLVRSGVPLPFGAVDNRRSMVAIDNLVDFLTLCVRHPAAAGATFMISDDCDLSIAQLHQLLARAMGKTARSISVPPAWIAALAAGVGKAAVADRLLGSLQVDIGGAKHSLNWRPLVSVETAIQATVADFLVKG